TLAKAMRDPSRENEKNPLQMDGVVTGSGSPSGGPDASATPTRHRFTGAARREVQVATLWRPGGTPIDREVVGHRPGGLFALGSVGGDGEDVTLTALCPQAPERDPRPMRRPARLHPVRVLQPLTFLARRHVDDPQAVGKRSAIRGG